MAKQRAVVSVHIDIAALCWATRDLKTESEWAVWGRSFVEALATRTPSTNAFAASVMQEVEDHRAAEAERIKQLRGKGQNHVQDVQVQSVPDTVQTVSKSDSKSVSQSVSKKEERSKRGRFTPPSLEDVTAYCTERANSIEPARFIDHYQARGWRLKDGPMVDWKAAVRTWEGRNFQPVSGKPQTNHRDLKRAKEHDETLSL